MCPHCGRDAPIVYRGVVPRCTACGGLRPPLSGPSVNLAGAPARVGGTFATAVGGAILLVGLSLSLGLGLLLNALTTLAVAVAFVLPIGLVTLGVGLFFLLGGLRLRQTGSAQLNEIRASALLGLAAEKGAITAAEAAAASDLPLAEADAILTDLAKRHPERVAVDVDDQGVVWYRAVSNEGTFRSWAGDREDAASLRGNRVRVGGSAASDNDFSREVARPGGVRLRADEAPESAAEDALSDDALGGDRGAKRMRK